MDRFRQLRNQRTGHSSWSVTGMLQAIGCVVLAGMAGSYAAGTGNPAAPLMAMATGCNIKGNVSIETGERIYHVPGQKYYPQTVISPKYGERWFCSEAEARNAGWRRSKQ